MSNLVIAPKWNPFINQVDAGEEITGGITGNANIATRQLAENLFFLKDSMFELVTDISAGNNSNIDDFKDKIATDFDKVATEIAAQNAVILAEAKARAEELSKANAAILAEAQARAQSVKELNDALDKENEERVAAILLEAQGRQYALLAETAAREAALLAESQERQAALLAEATVLNDTIRQLDTRVNSTIDALTETITIETSQNKTDIEANARILNALKINFDDNKASVINEFLTVADNISALSSQILSLKATTENTNADILIYREAKAELEAATALEITNIKSSFQENNASFAQQIKTLVDANSASTAQLSNLESTVNDNLAQLIEKDETLVNADKALAQRITNLNSEFDTNKATVDNQLLTISDAASALASSVSNLSAATEDKLATIINKQQTLTNATESQAETLSYISAEIDMEYASKDEYADKTKGTIWTTAKAIARGDHVNATKIEGLTAQVKNSNATFINELEVNATATESAIKNIETLSTQLLGGYNGSDINEVTEGLIYQERNARSTAIEGMAEQISLLSAGVGEQFDSSIIWHFNNDNEDWINGIYADGYIKVTNETISSPIFEVDGNVYHHMKMRVQRVGEPVWQGKIDSLNKTFQIPEPIFVDDVALVSFDTKWLGMITTIELKLASVADDNNYYLLDWIAIGRPSPGASMSGLLEVKNASAARDLAIAQSVTALDAKLNTKSSELASSINTKTETLTTEQQTQAATIVALDSKIDTIDQQLSSSISQNNTTLTTKQTALAEAIGVLTSKTNDAAAQLITDLKTLTDKDSALTQQITALTSQLEDANAHIVASDKTFTDADIALAESISQLTAEYNSNKAEINTQLKTLADANVTTATKFDNVSANFVTVNSNIDKNTQAIAAEKLITAKNTADITAERTARTTAVSAQALRIDTLQTQVNDNSASATTRLNTLVDVDKALSERLDVLTANTDSSTGTINQRLTVLTNKDTALTESITQLITKVDNNNASVNTKTAALTNKDNALALSISQLSSDFAANNASVTEKLEALTNADSASATRLDGLSASIGIIDTRVGAGEQGLVDVNGKLIESDIIIARNTADLRKEEKARADSDTAIVSSITNLTSQVAGNNADINQKFTTVSTQTTANATAITDLSSVVVGNKAAANQQFSAITSSAATEAAKLENLKTSVEQGNVKSAADILEVKNSISTANQAISTQNTSIRAAFKAADDAQNLVINKNKADIVTTNSALADAVQSIATTSTQLSAEFNGKFDNISIGGRNLIRDSRFSKGWTITSSSNASVVRGEYNLGPYLKITCLTSNATFGVSQLPADRTMKVLYGRTYTLSFFGSGTMNQLNYVYLMSDTHDNFNVGEIKLNSSISTIQSITFTSPWSASDAYILIAAKNYGAGQWFQFGNLKLEEGTYPTSWSPSPEDVDANIEAVNTIVTKNTADIATTKTSIADTNTALASQNTSIRAAFKAVDDAQNLVINKNKADIVTTNSALATAVESIATTRTQLKSEFDGLAVGGRNLLKFEHITPYGATTIDAATGEFVLPFTPSVRAWISIQLSNLVKLEINTTYVLSFKIRKVSGTMSTIGGHLSPTTLLGLRKDGVSLDTAGDLNWRDNNFGTSATTKKYEVIFSISQTDNLIYIQPGRGDGYSETGEVRIWDIQIEKGNRASDYTPTLEDVSSDIKIGGRNLLKNSGTTVISDSYNIADYPLVENIAEGELVTATIWGTLASEKIYFRAYNSGGQSTPNTEFVKISDGVYRTTFKWEVKYTNSFLRIYHMPNSATVKSTINRIKLERGNRGTDWVEAGEVYYDESTKGKNLYNYLDVTFDSYVTSVGTAGSSVHKISDYIEVRNNTEYTVSVDPEYGTFSGLRIIQIDANKLHISSTYDYILNTSSKTFLTVNECMYIRFSAESRTEEQYKKWVLAKGGIPLKWTPAVGSIGAVIVEEAKTSANATTAVANRVNTLETNVGTNTGKITTLQNTTTTLDAAIAKTRTDLTASFNSVSVGGTNLLRNSTFNKGFSEYGTYSTIIQGFSTLGLYTKVTAKAANETFGVTLPGAYRTTSIIQGRTYTLSFWGQSTFNSLNYVYLMRTDGGNHSLPNIPMGTGSNNKRSVTFVAPWTTEVGYILMAARDYPVNSWFMFGGLKLEEGDRASDWSPSPVDIDAEIATTNAAVSSEASTRATNDNALSSRIDTVSATASQNTGKITTLQSTVVTLDSAITKARTDLTANYTSAINTAKNSANDYTDLTSKVLVVDSNTKKFINPTGFASNSSALTGYLIIETPILPNRMCNVKISGYNYLSENSGISVNVSFYIQSAMYNSSYESTGSFPIEKVQVGKTAAGSAVIILGLPTHVWRYPKVTVDEALVGHSSSPDSYKDGWNIQISPTISGYNSLIDVKGLDVLPQLVKNSADITSESVARANAISALASTVNELKTTVTATTSLNTFRLRMDWQRWTNYSGGGELTTSSSNGLILGNNSGDDQQWIIRDENIPLLPGVIYKISARYRNVSGTGSTYIGVAGVASNGTTFVNVSGGDTYGSQHYIGVDSTISGWTEMSGYIAAAGTVMTGIPNARSIHGSAEYFRPLIIANYANKPGVTYIDWYKVEVVDGEQVAAIKTTQESINGIEARATIETNVNGKISGIYLKSTNTYSSFDVNVTDFKVSYGSSTVTPFRVYNGITHIDDAMIRNASITDAKITNLHGNKITANTITATQIAAKTVTAAQMAAKTITAASGIIGDLAVDTLQIKGNAVTVSALFFSEQLDTFNIAATEQEIAGVTINAEGGSVAVSFGFESLKVYNYGDNTGATIILRLKRDSVVIRSITFKAAGTIVNSAFKYENAIRREFITFATLLDSPPSGNRRYSVTAQTVNTNETYISLDMQARSLMVSGAKR